MNRTLVRIGRNNVLVSSMVLCALALAPQLTGGATPGFAFIAKAAAQGTGLGGGGRGTGSGGTTGGTAGPRAPTNGSPGAAFGGSTAGSGASSGGTGASTGPGSVNQNRFGGNFTVPTPPPTDPTVPPSATTAPTVADPTTIMQQLTGSTGGEVFKTSDRCAAHVAGQASPTERLSGRNLEFLNAAQAYLAPAFDAGKLKSGLYLLANYQEEMEKKDPNAETAGAYLGLVATRPVTEDVVARANAILCVTSSAKLAAAVAATAEQERNVTQR